MNKKATPARLGLLLAYFMVCILSSRAAIINWTNTSGGSWSAATNWSPNQIPGSNDTANITVAGLSSYVVTMNVSPTVAGFVLGATNSATFQTLAIDGDTLTVNGSIQINAQGQFNFNGGLVAGTNVLTGILTWSGGSISGNMTIATNSVLNIVNGGGDGFNGLVLSNYGTVNWTNATLYGVLLHNAQIYNYGLWNAQSDNVFQGGYNNGTSLFENFGTFLKSGNNGTTTLDGNVVFNNMGAVSVLSGTLTIQGGGTNSASGTFTTTNSGALILDNMNFVTNLTFNSTNLVQLGGNTTMNGTITAPSLQYVGSGTLSGTNVLVGALTWSGGSIVGNMTISNNSIFNIVNGGGDGFNGVVLTNFGTVNWTNSTIYGLNSQNVQIYNYGLWNAQSDNTFEGGYNNGTSLFDNFGTFLKSGNAGTTTLDGSVVFNNTGTVSVNSGTLSIQGGGVTTGGGSYNTSNGGLLVLNNMTFPTNVNINSSTVVTVEGTTVMNGLIAPNIQLAGNGSSLSGTNVMTTGLIWSSGSISGNMTIASNAVFSIVNGGGDGFNGLVLTNFGTVRWTNSTLYGVNTRNAQIYNYGLWNAQSDNAFEGGYNNGTSLFDNFGTFLKSGNAGTTTLDNNLVFNNTGTVTVNSGTLTIQGGGTNSGSGTFATANGGALILDNMTFTTNITFSSTNLVQLGGNTTINGNITAPNLQLTGNGASLSGTNVLLGTLTWSSGSLAGILTIPSNSVLNIVAGGGDGFNGLILTNFGTVNWTNATLYGLSGLNAHIYNYGLWNAQSDSSFQGGYNNGTTLFDNFGTFLKSGNTGVTTLDGNVLFNNTGTVSVLSGTLGIYGGGTNSGGTFVTTNSAIVNFLGIPYTFTNLTTFVGASNFVAGGATFGGTIAGTLTWDGGSIAGLLTVPTNSVFNIVNGGGDGFNGLVLTNFGTVTWTNTSLYGLNGHNAQIYNYGFWIAQSSSGWQGGYNSGTTLFDNFGTFLKSGNAGTTTLDNNVMFNNTGTISVQSGTVSLSTYNLTGGTLNFGINSLTNFGTITLAGNPALTGSISANLNSGYVPFVSNAFPVLNFASSSGAFTGTNLPPVAIWQTTVNPTNVTIKVLKLVPQLTWANPANIVYGTLLSGVQLDATAASPTNLSGSLAGTFVYTPPVGTSLLAGSNQILSAAFTPADLVNYTNASISATITVLKAPLTITASAQSKTYGQTLNLGTNAFTTTVLSNSDTVTAVTLSSVGAAGTASVFGSPYTITPSAAAGTGLANYNITYQSGNLTVNPAPLTITANSQSKTYGQTLNLGTNAFTTTVLSNSDTVTGVTLSSPGAAATATVAGSPYAITPSAAVGTGLTNYTIAYQAGNLTVNLAMVTISSGLTANSKVYDRTTLATLNSNSVVLAGIVNGDAVSLNTNGYAANFASAGVGSGLAVTVSGLTLSGVGAANYLLTQPSALTANITAAAVTISSGLTANSKMYDTTTTATLSSNNVILAGVITGDTVGLSTNGYVANFASLGVSNGLAVIVSGLTLTGATAADYSLTEPTGLTANITAPSLQIVASLPIVVISWPTNATAFTLNQTANLAPQVTWTPVTNNVSVNGTNNTVTINVGAVSGGHYFELIAAP